MMTQVRNTCNVTFRIHAATSINYGKFTNIMLFECGYMRCVRKLKNIKSVIGVNNYEVALVKCVTGLCTNDATWCV